MPIVHLQGADLWNSLNCKGLRPNKGDGKGLAIAKRCNEHSQNEMRFRNFR